MRKCINSPNPPLDIGGGLPDYALMPNLASSMLAAYLQAETDVLLGKEARLGDRVFRSEDLAEIRAGRQEWERRVATERDRESSAPTLGGLRFCVARLD